MRIQRDPEQPRILGDFPTLSEGLDYAAQGAAGLNFYAPRGGLEETVTYHELRNRALATGRRLVKAGLKRGERVGVIAETKAAFVEVFFGCQYAGLVPCPMPYSMYIGGRDAYVTRIAGLIESADCSAVVTPEDLHSHITEAAAIAGAELVLTHDALAAISGKDVDLTPFNADDVAYIQYSSGSTSNPKGVLITQRAAMANVSRILKYGMGIRDDDRAFSWLPLYHDMGLVGFLLSPCMGQVTVDYLATPAFARRPALWLKLMSDNRCTVAYGPSFGYDLSSRRVNGGAKDLDLSAWRIAGIGGDMVRPDVLEEFASRMAVAGFDPKAFLPSYGMAESTLAITFTELDKPVRVDCVDRLEYKMNRKAVAADDLAQKRPEQTRSFVVCGKPLPDHKIEVRDDHGKVLSEREIGHILIQGPSLMAGYFGNEHATKNVLSDDGWLDTGDMGYWLDGEIVITGRSKDLILHNGRNIWPQDIEWSAEHVEPLRSGDVAAFAVEDDNDEDHVVVLVQCRLGKRDEREALRREVKAAIQRSAGVECFVVLVPPRSLPFTSSGKLSRAGAKAGFLSREIEEIDDEYVPVGAAPAAAARVGMQAAE
ncbi:MAG: fatty acyl-AMP ligase [Alphaproteobacteria bacterium]|nr:fatty acyl-AMP ligase [Alphaproteobacteria bacterium]